MDTRRWPAEFEIVKYLEGDDEVDSKIMVLTTYLKWKRGPLMPVYLLVRLSALQDLQKVLEEFMPSNAKQIRLRNRQPKN